MNVRSLLSRRKWKDESHQPRFLRCKLSYMGVTALLLSMTMLLLSACTGLFPQPARSGTPDTSVVGTVPPTATAVLSTPTPTVPSISFSSSGCPATPVINWDKLIGTKAGVNKVQKVTCGTFEGGALAALVGVRYYTPDAKLDVSVYDNLTGTPYRRFQAQGLIGGDAQISPANTIMTAENPTNDQFGKNVFKEYSWNGSGYGQILFPGLYPYATHYQAEQEQAIANTQIAQATATPTAKSNVWQASAGSVVSHMALDIFHWALVKSSVQTFSSQTATYIINTTNLGPGGGGFTTSLFRLDGVATNIFEVKQVTSIDGTALLNSPTNNQAQPLSSPIRVSGSYNSSGSILGRVAIYSDTYVTVGDTGAIHGSAPSGAVSFAPAVSFKLNAGGLQEGIVAFYVTNQNNIANSNQVVLAKVFLSA